MPCAATGPGHQQFCTGFARGKGNGERVNGFYTILRKARDIGETFFIFLSLSSSVLFPSLSVPFFFFVRFRPAVFSSYVEYCLFPLFIFRPFQRASLKRGTTFYGGN